MPHFANKRFHRSVFCETSVRELLPGAGSQISEDCIFLSLIRLFCEFTLIQSALSTLFVRSFNLTKFLQQCAIYSTDRQ